MSRKVNIFNVLPACDSDALAFLAATGITDATIKSAICTLYSELKAAGIYNKLTAFYPFVGGTAFTHKFNGKNPLDSNPAYRLQFFGGWTHSANGAQPNGVNGYANTFLIPNTKLTLLDTHLSFYSRTSIIGNNQRDIAAYRTGGIPSLSLGTNTGVLASDQYWFTTNRISASIPNALGMMLGSRTSDVIHKAYRNGVQIGLTDTVSNAGKSMPSINLFLGAANSFPIATGAFSNKEYAFVSIGSGLTSAETLSYYNIVQTFQTSLSRNV